MTLTDRLAGACTLAVALLLAAAPAARASVLCHTGPGSGGPGTATAEASARILEAAAEAMLAYRTLDEPGPAFAEHRRRSGELLDAAVADYRRAQATSPELRRLDEFLRARPFEALRVSFGIAPGTLTATRWDALAAAARKSPRPTSDLVGVCVAGAQSLKAGLASLTPETSPAQRRRALNAWLLFLSHGALVSDALDPSVRVGPEPPRR